jgi:hypothetical protein
VATITTVGFGDISGGTTPERYELIMIIRIICISLMVIGVISFSFATGSLSNILANIDSSQAKLKEKLDVLNDIRKDYKIGYRMYEELKMSLKFDHSRNQSDVQNFLNELPYRLRLDLAVKIHRQIVA